MSHVASHHCGGVGEIVRTMEIHSDGHTKELPCYSRLNLAIALNEHGMGEWHAWFANKVIYLCRLVIYKVAQVGDEQIHAAPEQKHDWY